MDANCLKNSAAKNGTEVPYHFTEGNDKLMNEEYLHLLSPSLNLGFG